MRALKGLCSKAFGALKIYRTQIRAINSQKLSLVLAAKNLAA